MSLQEAVDQMREDGVPEELIQDFVAICDKVADLEEKVFHGD